MNKIVLYLTVTLSLGATFHASAMEKIELKDTFTNVVTSLLDRALENISPYFFDYQIEQVKIKITQLQSQLNHRDVLCGQRERLMAQITKKNIWVTAKEPEYVKLEQFFLENQYSVLEKDYQLLEEINKLREQEIKQLEAIIANNLQ